MLLCLPPLESFHDRLALFTFHNQPGKCSNIPCREGNGAGVLHGEVQQGETMHTPLGTHAAVVAGLESDPILLPHPFYIGV